ncbi:MAG: PH domain-containing protein [Microbacteriaceae bacterium]
MSAALSAGPGPWQRVSARYALVDAAGWAVRGALLTAVTLLPWLAAGLTLGWLLTVAAGCVTVVVVALTPRRVRAIGYRLRDDDLVLCRGLAWRRIVAVPYGRMQLVDIEQGPLARLLGLAELRLVTAAASGTLVLPGLAEDTAAGLRDRLVALAETRRTGL